MVAQFPGLKVLFPTGSSLMKIPLKSKAVVSVCVYIIFVQSMFPYIVRIIMDLSLSGCCMQFL
jgi:hypothetical protein